MGHLPIIMAINLTYQNETSEQINEQLFVNLLPQIDGEGDVSLTIVNDDKIQELNREYRGKDTPTDVISFAFNETDAFPGENLLGEIYISIESARKQSGSSAIAINQFRDSETPSAKRQAEDLDHELKFLFVHGVLHLLGYTHETDEKYEVMMELTKKIVDDSGQ